MRRKKRLFTCLSLAACALACLALPAPCAGAQRRTKRRGSSHTSAPAKSPLTKTYLLGALRGGKPTARALVALVNGRGVDFQLTEEDESQLRKAGATAGLLEAVRDNYQPPPVLAPPAVSGTPTARAEPSFIPPDTTGTPQGVSESGPGMGSGRKSGTGEGGGGMGVGTGEGTGYGPGRGEGNSTVSVPDTGPVDYSRTFKSSEVTVKAVLTSKPEPILTEEQRKTDVVGTVRLRAILSADGAVRGITVIKGLPGGFTEKAIEAAKQIRFKPAQKDGHTVSQYVELEYNFNVY